MKQITWHPSTTDTRAYPVFRDTSGSPWQPLNKHAWAIGETDFQKFQALLRQGYEAITSVEEKPLASVLNQVQRDLGDRVEIREG